MSKVHLGVGEYRFMACGRSGKLGQDKGVVTGVSPRSFRHETKPENRCKTCTAIFLKKRNQQRNSKGLPPVQHMDE